MPAQKYVTLSHRGFLTVGVDQYRLLSRSKASPWAATLLERNRISANFQGSPLWPQTALERYPALCRHFGLNSNVGRTSCILPVTKNVNDKLSRLTDCVFKFRDLSDYQLGEDGSLSAKLYVDNFIDDKVLPMGDFQNRDSIHDWSYHFLTLLMPDYLENIRLNLAFIRDHIEQFSGQTNYRWNYYGHSLNEIGALHIESVAEVMDHKAAVYRQMAIALDVASAKIVQLISIEQRGLLGNCKSEISTIGAFLKSVNKQALRTILWLEQDLPFTAPNLEIDTNAVMPLIHAKFSQLEREIKASSYLAYTEERDSVFTKVIALLEQQDPDTTVCSCTISE